MFYFFLKEHIGMGVRFNAEKSSIGNYYSTKIYQFKMTCHLCSNSIVIRSDPQNFTYTVIKGARRKEQRYDPEQNNQIATFKAADKRKLENNAMFNLEHQ